MIVIMMPVEWIEVVDVEKAFSHVCNTDAGGID